MSERDQTETITFLADPASYGPDVGTVERIETHGALVFLAGFDVYKIKRAVDFPYMNFSTLERRRVACAREVEINRPAAPEIYLGLAPIRRQADGHLGFGGDGEVIEWAVHMRRFDGDAMLSRIADRSGISADLARDLADAVFEYHQGARVFAPPPGATPELARSLLRKGQTGSSEMGPGVELLASVIDEVAGALGDPALAMDRTSAAQYEARCRAELSRLAPLLERRTAAGKVRRCHGDLHLNNIILWQGRPTPFDAIEFDEELATIDVLYDLAFLLMDLEKHAQREAANRVLNRYLWRSQDMLDIEGLAALPLFLGLRSGIRAMVGAQRAGQLSGTEAENGRGAARGYLTKALAYLSPAAPRLVAVGGVSGTGKSTLAAALAALIPPAPGAFHLRSDLERKAMLGKGETERLPPESYTAEASARVYELLLSKARTALQAGHSVILDAAHLKEDEKSAAADLARDCGVPFRGLWLTAQPDVLRARVGARTGDASDATVAVLEQQLAWLPDAGDWTVLDAGGAREPLVSQASALL